MSRRTCPKPPKGLCGCSPFPAREACAEGSGVPVAAVAEDEPEQKQE